MAFSVSLLVTRSYTQYAHKLVRMRHHLRKHRHSRKRSSRKTLVRRSLVIAGWTVVLFGEGRGRGV